MDQSFETIQKHIEFSDKYKKYTKSGWDAQPIVVRLNLKNKLYGKL